MRVRHKSRSEVLLVLRTMADTGRSLLLRRILVWGRQGSYGDKPSYASQASRGVGTWVLEEA